MTYGILCAMPEEFGPLAAEIKQQKKAVLYGREFIIGILHGHRVVAVISRIGKVAAAMTCTLLIDHFGVDAVLFCGIAGSLQKDVRIGDIVIASDCVQHDFYLSDTDFFRIPLLDIQSLPCDSALSDRCRIACERFLAAAAQSTPELQDFWQSLCIRAPRVHTGTIASGDQFVSGGQRKAFIQSQLPNAKCVEMEGAAVAQTCYEAGVPCAVIRIISDGADEGAEIAFDRFVSAASLYTRGILSALLQKTESK